MKGHCAIFLQPIRSPLLPIDRRRIIISPGEYFDFLRSLTPPQAARLASYVIIFCYSVPLRTRRPPWIKAVNYYVF